jgi:integrase/recombinase XerD
VKSLFAFLGLFFGGLFKRRACSHYSGRVAPDVQRRTRLKKGDVRGMGSRRKNTVDFGSSEMQLKRKEGLSYEEAKVLFLRDCRHLAKQTQRWHRENLNSFEKILGRQGIVVGDVAKLSASYVKSRYVYYMVEDMGLKPNTVNGRIRTLKAFAAYLVQEGHIQADFAVDLKLIRVEKVVIQTFSEEQLERLLRQPDRHTFTGLRDYTLLLFLLETGVRINECLEISLEDIRMTDGQILIHGKGSKQRLVPFQSKFRRALQDYLKIRGKVESKALFVTIDGNQVSKRYVQELIQAYGEKAKITGVRVSPHTFRHTMAKYYILAGGDVFSLQKILGHSSVETVKIYVEMFTNDVHAQHKRFSFLENHLT